MCGQQKLGSGQSSIIIPSISAAVHGCTTVGMRCPLSRVTSVGAWMKKKAVLPITIVEIRAVILALIFQEHVMVFDNVTVAAYFIKQEGTMSCPLYLLTQQVFGWMEFHSIELVVRFVPRRSRDIADQLSHQDQVIGTEWSLHPQVFDTTC